MMKNIILTMAVAVGYVVVNDVLFWNWKNWLLHNQQLLQYQHLLIIYRYETE